VPWWGKVGLTEIILSRSYLLCKLLNINFGREERFCGALDILAAILAICSDHLVVKEGMTDIFRMLLMGLERKVSMESRVPIL